MEPPPDSKISVMQLDLSRQKLYVSPDDPLPQFHPLPRAIQITPIYDTSPSNPEIRDFNQSSSTSRKGPLIVNRSSQHIDPSPGRYQPEASSNWRPGDRSYAYSPTRDQGYDSDPSHYPTRGRYSRSYPRGRRRSSDYDDSSNNGRPRGDDASDYDRSDYAPERHHSQDYDRDSSDYDRPSSGYDRPSSDYDRPSSDYDRPSSGYDRPSSGYDRSLPQHQQHSSTKPYSQTPHKPERPTHTPKKLTAWQRYLEANKQAAHRDPFGHLKSCPEEIQRVLKALPPSPHFCWSECTGRRKAVCIGINYVGQKDELKGCANDARHMRSFLMKNYRFRNQNVLLLTDDGQPASMKPTRKNMFDAMNWLVKEAKAHDSLFFHYSGHGGQVPDKTGTETDGLDEVIFPADFKSTSHIADNDLFTALVAPLPTGCRLTAVFDSCHSGTILDLPYLHSAHGRLRSLVHITHRAQQRGVGSSADVICFAACKDDETSADTRQGGVAVGAMSYALLKILKSNAENSSHQTYGKILQQLRDILIPKYNQKAQLSGTHPVDLERDFTL